MKYTKETSIYNKDAISNGMSDAASSATNYISLDNAEGLVVGNQSDDTMRGNVQLAAGPAVNLRDGTDVIASFATDGISLGGNSDHAYVKMCGNKGVIRFIDGATPSDDDVLEIASASGVNADVRLKSFWSTLVLGQGISLSTAGEIHLDSEQGSGKLADWVVSRVAHESRDAIVTTWASGRVEVNGTITKNHSGSTSQDQLPSITEFKADATYNKSVVTACNGDYTAKQFFVTGCGIKQDGSVFCGISPAYTGGARINYRYDLR